MDSGDRIGGEFLLRSAVRHSVEAYYGCYTGLFPFSREEASHKLNCIAQRCLAFYHDYCTYYLLIPQFSVQTPSITYECMDSARFAARKWQDNIDIYHTTSLANEEIYIEDILKRKITVRHLWI
jgi:hypothetical protein